MRTLDASIKRDLGAAARSAGRYIELSWERCRAQYELSRQARRPPTFISSAELEDRRQDAGFAFPVACAELKTLSALLRGPIGITLTDHEGVILASARPSHFAETADRLGLRPGAVWHESQEGTNGMGTCLAEGNPVVIEQSQHYLQQNATLSCYGAPIFDGVGKVVGVLNASIMGSMEPMSILALLDCVARNIEHRSLMNRQTEHFVLRLHSQREYLSTSAEAILLVNRVGVVEQINRAALEVLAETTYADVCGHSVSSLLGMELPELRGLASARPPRARYLQRAPYFALAHPPINEEPQPHSFNAPGAMGEALEDAERRTLTAALSHCNGNVTEAAGQLGISRRTLHRKLLRYGICRECYA